jgi:aspartate/methionine/tyrosine aminotransferase
MAGYRAAFVAGDPRLVSGLLATRKHLGMIVPAPVQAAMTAALGDDAHVAAQRDVYGARRAALAGALRAAGFVIDGSEAGLYLWARPADGAAVPGVAAGASSRELAAWFARRGILVGPGEFYGVAGRHHVRVALTAPDDSVARAVARITPP